MAKFPDPASRPLSPPLPQNPSSAAPKPPVDMGIPSPLPPSPPPPPIAPSPPTSPLPPPSASPTPDSLPPLLVKQQASAIDTPIAPPPPMAPPSPPLPPTPPSPPSPPLPNIVENPIAPPPPPTGFSSPPSPPSPPPGASLPPLPPTPPPAVPAPESPSTDSSVAQPSDAKKSPFRFLIPILIGLIVVGVIGFLAFKFLLNRPNSSSTNNSSDTTSTASQKSTGETVNLEYWGLWEPSAVLEAEFQDFESQNPGVKITYTQQSPQDYRERLQSAFAKGTGPDIFRFHNTWVPMLRTDLDQLPSTAMSATDFQSTFYPVAATDLKGDKSFYGIPLMIDGLGLYYNKTIFSNSSLTPPTSWEDLRKDASQLTIRSGDKLERAGIALGITSNVDNFSDILGLMLLQNKADPANPTNSLASDALSFYTLFNTQDQVWDETLPPSTFAFATEKVAMMIAPSWRAHEVKDINPQIDFAIVPVPQLPGNDVSWASYWVEGVSKKSKHTDMAWKLLVFLSSKENMRKLYTAASNQRLFGEPFSRVDMADQLLSDPYVGAYIQQAPKAKSWYLSSRTFDNGINDRIIKYYEDAVNAANSGTDPDTALQTTAQGVVQILSQYSSTAAR